VEACVKVDMDKLKDILALMKQEDVAEFEHETEELRFRIVRGRPAAPLTMPHVVAAAAPVAPPPPASRRDVAAGLGDEPPAGFVDVTSPFVGTFYRAAGPDAAAFVDVGSAVKQGQALCIIEAMKLMNEIEADFACTVTDVFAQNGKAVEFGQKLFRVKKA
jgi:acetyl-CoA carboxylase biotin carboxyl carrier protein